MGLATLLASVWLDGCENFTRREIQTVGGAEGPPLAEWTPDSLRLRIVARREAVSQATLLMAMLLRAPTLPDSAIEREIARRSFVQPNPWTLALDALRWDVRHATPDGVRELHAQLVRPERITIAIVGDITEHLLTENLRTRLADWRPPPVTWRTPPHRAPATWTTAHQVREISGPALPGNSLSPESLLAVAALGIGKEATVFRTWREDHGWSYRQEAFLWPTSGGVRLRAVMVQADGSKEAPLDAARQALIEDIGRWDDATRNRALAMLESWYQRQAPFAPVYYGPRSPARIDSLGDRASWHAWWYMKTGSPFIWDRFNEVSTSGMQAWARHALGEQS